jgi:hypothetical protein
MADSVSPAGEIYVVVGEAGQPQVAYEREADAEALRDEWRDDYPSIRAEVREITLYEPEAED